MGHLPYDELSRRLEWIRGAPLDQGTVRLVVRRPAIGEREVLGEAVLDTGVGMVGDNWKVKGSTSTPDGSANPLAQVTVMGWRAIVAVADCEDRYALAGDQLYVDLDLSVDNLPPGTRLTVGTGVLEVTTKPHTGCAKFAARFGAEALRFVNTGPGRQLRLRGLNARVVEGGVVRPGDTVTVSRPAPGVHPDGNGTSHAPSLSTPATSEVPSR